MTSIAHLRRMASLKTLRMWYPLVKNPSETSVLFFHFSKTDVSFDSLSFQWNLGKCPGPAPCFCFFLVFLVIKKVRCHESVLNLRK